jgi:hypothetical protein
VLNLHVQGQVIRTTGVHPFYRHGTGWTRAIDLKSGDWLLTASDRWVMVEEVYDTGEVRAVYNLRVADLHTYFVGDDGWGWNVWAHNSSPEECPGLRKGREKAKKGTKEGIYEFPDQTKKGNPPYVGQSGDMDAREKKHESAGRKKPGEGTRREVLGGKTAREIAEHNRIQDLTGGQAAKNSNAVANERDPIGPKRRPGFGLPDPWE